MSDSYESNNDNDKIEDFSSILSSLPENVLKKLEEKKSRYLKITPEEEKLLIKDILEEEKEKTASEIDEKEEIARLKTSKSHLDKRLKFGITDIPINVPTDKEIIDSEKQIREERLESSIKDYLATYGESATESFISKQIKKHKESEYIKNREIIKKNIEEILDIFGSEYYTMFMNTKEDEITIKIKDPKKNKNILPYNEITGMLHKTKND